MDSNSVYPATTAAPTAVTANTARDAPASNASAIASELRGLDAELSALHDRMDLLAKALDPALAPPAPDGEAKARPPCGMSPLALKARTYRESIGYLTSRVNALLTRVEL